MNSQQSNIFHILQTDRLHDYVLQGNVAFSGMKFFSITRSFIISVIGKKKFSEKNQFEKSFSIIAGTILTYELVLLQYDAENIDLTMFHPCQNKPKNQFFI